MTWKRLLIGLVFIAVLLAGGVFTYFQFFAPQDESPAVEAEATANESGRIEAVAVNVGLDSVSAEGQIVPLRHANLAFTGAGVVTELFAAEGMLVTTGQPILRLDTTDQELALAQATAQLAQTEANLAAAQAGLRAAEAGIEAAELGVQAAEVELSLAQSAPTAEVIALQEGNVALAEARVTQASAAQQLVLEGATASQIRAAEADLLAAEARVLPAQLRLDGVRRQENPDPEVLARAERDYNAAVTAVEAAREALNQLQTGATDAQRRAANSGLAATTAQRDAVQAELRLLLAGNQAEQITIAEAGVAQAEAAVGEAQARLVQASAAVSQAEADVARSQAAVASAQTQVDDRTLVAPFDGTVAAIQTEIGEVVAAGNPVVTLADFSGWLVETTDLTENDVVAIATGFPATIRVDALPDLTLTGTVGDGNTSGIANEAVELRGDITYKVTIRLDDTANTPLRWGMTVFATIDTSGN